MRHRKIAPFILIARCCGMVLMTCFQTRIHDVAAPFPGSLEGNRLLQCHSERAPAQTRGLRLQRTGRGRTAFSRRKRHFKVRCLSLCIAAVLALHCRYSYCCCSRRRSCPPPQSANTVASIEVDASTMHLYPTPWPTRILKQRSLTHHHSKIPPNQSSQNHRHLQPSAPPALRINCALPLPRPLMQSNPRI